MKFKVEKKRIENQTIKIQDKKVLCFDVDGAIFAFIRQPRKNITLNYEIELNYNGIEVRSHDEESFLFAIKELYEFGDQIEQIPIDEFLNEFNTRKNYIELLSDLNLQKLNTGDFL